MPGTGAKCDGTCNWDNQAVIFSGVNRCEFCIDEIIVPYTVSKQALSQPKPIGVLSKCTRMAIMAILTSEKTQNYSNKMLPLVTRALNHWHRFPSVTVSFLR